MTNGCFPGGLVRPFLKNCMSLMTTTGAKGGLVNFSQIAAMLGQQDLEGRRVPRMSSGKTLPCFIAFDAGARANGFVADRFLTGALHSVLCLIVSLSLWCASFHCPYGVRLMRAHATGWEADLTLLLS